MGISMGHLTQVVKDLLRKAKIDQAIIPGGATGHIQAPDVSWNKPWISRKSGCE